MVTAVKCGYSKQVSPTVIPVYPHTHTLITASQYASYFDVIKGTQDLKICPSHAETNPAFSFSTTFYYWCSNTALICTTLSAQALLSEPLLYNKPSTALLQLPCTAVLDTVCGCAGV